MDNPVLDKVQKIEPTLLGQGQQKGFGLGEVASLGITHTIDQKSIDSILVIVLVLIGAATVGKIIVHFATKNS